MKRLILIAITMIFSSALVHAYDYENQRRLQARDSGKPLTETKQKETQSTKQKKQKTAAGAKATVIDGSDRDHGQINQRLGDPNDNITQAMMAFLDGILEEAPTSDSAE